MRNSISRRPPPGPSTPLGMKGQDVRWMLELLDPRTGLTAREEQALARQIERYETFVGR